MLSLFGLFIYTLLQLGSTLSYKWISVYYALYAAEIFIGFTGGIASLFMASFAIVTDDCRHQMLPVAFLIIFFSALKILNVHKSKFYGKKIRRMSDV